MSYEMFVDLSTISYNKYSSTKYGGKAANIVRMMGLGLPVPPAVVIPTIWSTRNRKIVEMRLEENLSDIIVNLQNQSGHKFGAATKANFPLLVSVRSGAPVSMPGMMDTVLNVGLNDKSVKSLAANTNPEFAWDSYRRFIQSYGSIVLQIPASKFESFVTASRHFCPSGIPTVAISQHLVDQFKILCGGAFPQDVKEQLHGCISAVWDSWNSERAEAYRNVEGISHQMGTAVTIQQMVFGNLNNNSGTGVLFTRNPVNGDPTFYGDFLINAQGEDVVSGTTKTMPIQELNTLMPDIYNELQTYSGILERSLCDMCDIEFTIQDGKLYVLQVRSGKRSAKASNRIALHLLNEGIVNVEEAEAMLQTIKTSSTETETDGFKLVGKGLVASEGEVTGVLALSKEKAIELHEQGKIPILLTEATDPGDMPGIAVSGGIVTLTGGLVSHAALVARGWNIPCVVGLRDAGTSVMLFPFAGEVAFGDTTFKEGDSITIKSIDQDGSIYLKKAQ